MTDRFTCSHCKDDMDIKFAKSHAVLCNTSRLLLEDHVKWMLKEFGSADD